MSTEQEVRVYAVRELVFLIKDFTESTLYRGCNPREAAEAFARALAPADCVAFGQERWSCQLYPDEVVTWLASEAEGAEPGWKVEWEEEGEAIARWIVFEKRP